MFSQDLRIAGFDPELAVAIEQENRRLAHRVGEMPLSGLITRDPGMLKVCRQIEKLAPTDATVTLIGESGTGKEVLARGLHQLSGRRGRRFVAINCAAIPENLLESELFGHEKGAFTGATRSHKGLFQAAEGGTLLLDEIGDMPMRLQVKLLRVLQEHQVRPVGSTEAIQVDVRVISATHRDLMDMMRDGRFREDLYYRLNVINIETPPLRTRRVDIPVLVGDNSALRRATGWEPTIPLEQTLSDVLADWRARLGC